MIKLEKQPLEGEEEAVPRRAHVNNISGINRNVPVLADVAIERRVESVRNHPLRSFENAAEVADVLRMAGVKKSQVPTKVLPSCLILLRGPVKVAKVCIKFVEEGSTPRCITGVLELTKAKCNPKECQSAEK